MRRKIGIIFLFIIFLLRIQTVNALPFSIIVDSLELNGKINLPQESNGNAYWVSNVGNYIMKVNKKLAFCGDPLKQYTFGQHYEAVADFHLSSIISYIYSWAQEDLKSNEKTAQMLIWALRDDWSKQAYSGGHVIYLNLDEEEFVKKTSTYYLANKENSSRIQYKWILPNSGYCKCIYNMSCRISDKPSDTSDYIIRDGDTVELHLKSSLEVYTYNNEDRKKISYNDCKEIADQPTEEKKIEKYKEKTRNYSDYFNDNADEYNIRLLYRQIISAGAKSVSLYEPIGNSDAQPIIAPPTSELDPKSCSNYVATLREQGWTDAEIKNYLDTHNIDYFTDDNNKLKCADRAAQCAAGRRTFILLKKIKNPNFSPKIGNRWLYIYTPNPENQSDTNPKCECQEEADKFNARNSSNSAYQGNCSEFIAWYKRNIDPYAKDGKTLYCCDDDNCTHRLAVSGRYAACGDIPGDGPHYKCNELLVNNEYKKHRCSEVEDGYIDCDEGSDGKMTKLVCKNPCSPEVNTDFAYCTDKGIGGEGLLELSDAVTAEQTENLACINSGTAYNINNDTIGSKEAEVTYGQNSYCKIYCWESLSLQLPYEPQPKGYNYPIQAGRMFWWGINSTDFASMTTKRICWSRDIYYDKFESDWANNEASIKQKYADYVAQVNYNAQGKDKIKENGDCCVSGYHPGSSGGECCLKFNSTTDCLGGYSNATECFGHGWWGTKTTPSSCDNPGKKYSLPSVDYTIPGTNIKGTSNSKEKCSATQPSVSDLHDSGEEATRKNAVQSAINERTTIYNTMLKCQSTSMLNDQTMYNYGTELTIVDNTNLNLSNRGVKNFKLVRNDFGKVDVSSNTTNTVSKWLECWSLPGEFKHNAGDPCTDRDGSGYNIPTYLTYKWDYAGGSVWTYPTDFNFIAKVTDDNIISTIKVTEDNREQLERMFGFTFDLSNGIPTYINKASGKFDINLDIKYLGNMKDGKGHFDKIVENQDIYDFNFETYSCKYDLVNIIYCPLGSNDPDCPDKNGGLQIFYRIIEMAEGDKAKVFPGKEGSGRSQGSNWASFINNNYEKFKAITTSHNSNKGIYDKKPLYSIELSPTLIGEIRRSNNSYRDNNMDPYTSYKDSNGEYKIRCTTDNNPNNKSCTSNYITELIKKGKITGRLAIDNEEIRRNKISGYKDNIDSV